jgi:hypothetical protein
MEKWSFQAGARLEKYTIDALFKQVSKADGAQGDILVLYPSTFLNYNPSENNSFNLKFFGKS